MDKIRDRAYLFNLGKLGHSVNGDAQNGDAQNGDELTIIKHHFLCVFPVLIIPRWDTNRYYHSESEWNWD